MVLLLVAATSCDHKGANARALAHVGAARLLEAAQQLQPRAGHPDPVLVSPESWPPAIREMNPERVRVTKQGVYITLHSSFVEEDGVFVAADPTATLAGREGDPAFEVMAPRVYWYKIKG